MNNQPRNILPSIPLMEVTESNEYLTRRCEKSKQLMREKCAIESDEQRDKRNSQNALNICRKHALETSDENLNRRQNDSAQKRKRRLGQCVELESITTELLSASDRKLLRNFCTTMNKLSNKLCNVYNEQFPSIELVQGECRRCNREKSTPKKFSAENNMDPSDVPQELQNLTEVEEMLIAQVFTVVSVYNLRGGQYAYCRNVINFPQDVQEFATHLPHHPSSALHWLKENNVFYCNIEIADDVLQSLPENDTIIDQLSEASNSQELYNGQTDNLDVYENEDSEDFISQTFVPVLPPGCSENNAINNALNRIQYSQLQYDYPIVDWPHIESTPID
ncbi:16461_t:CDS:2, partial [Gigaspora rosea]